MQAEGIRSEQEFDEASKQVMDALQAHFKPEFLNRVDDIIVFRPLGKEQLVQDHRAAAGRRSASAGGSSNT